MKNAIIGKGNVGTALGNGMGTGIGYKLAKA